MHWNWSINCYHFHLISSYTYTCQISNQFWLLDKTKVMIHVFKFKLVIADKEKLTVALSLADSQSHTIFVFDGVSFRLVKWSLPNNLHVACTSLALLSCELDKNASKIKINLTWPHPYLWNENQKLKLVL